MDVISICPLRVAAVTWRLAPARTTMTVICKATFSLEPDECSLAETQHPPTKADLPWAGEAGTSVRTPTDFVPSKPLADVVLVGHARAPRGIPVTSIVTRLRAGALDKRVEAYGERLVDQDGMLLDSTKVAAVALRYEHAAGGPGTPNPVGRVLGSRDELGRFLLPNLQPFGLRPGGPDAPFPTTCYGPVAPSWPERTARLGAYAGVFSPERWWATPLPFDFDLRFFNAAPLDQQLEYLTGDEPLLLVNLLAHAPRLVTRLPGLRPVATVGRGPDRRHPLEFAADTLWIDTDNAICTLTWHAAAPLGAGASAERIEVGIEEIARRIVVALPGELERDGGRSEPAFSSMMLDDPDGGVTEPSYVPELAEPELAAAEAELAPTPLERAMPPAPRRSASSEDTITAEHDAVATSEALPFRSHRARPRDATADDTARLRHEPTSALGGTANHDRSSSRARAAIDASPGPDPGDTLSDHAAPALAAPTLPFRPATAPAAQLAGAIAPADRARPAAPPAPPPLVGQLLHTGPVAPPRGARSPWAGGGQAAAERVSGARLARQSDPPARSDLAPILSEGPLELPAEPELLGPLATPEMLLRAAEEQAAEASAAAEPAAPGGTQDSTSVSTEPLWEEGAFRLLHVDACAAIAASLAHRPDDAGQILEDARLTVPVWKANETYWSEMVREETAKGSSQLLRAYDTAFVARLELERGPIQVEEYARLVVAAERGSAASTLRELDLPQGSMVRIERVFLRRVVDNSALGDRIRLAVETLRGA